jgi:EmrB/QacA subfamily drug resistance transporter
VTARLAARPPSVPLLLAISALGSVLAPLNSTMIAVALPDIRDEFHLSHAAVGWLISGYLIAMAVAQPVGGRLGDQLGRKRVLRAGLFAFLLLSVAATLAPTFALLVAFRVGQAIAAAVLVPNGMAMLRTMAPPEQLGRLYGINGGILSTAAAAGPLLGAGALALGSWRWVFPPSIPLVLAALVLLGRLDAEDERNGEQARIDWIGLGLFVALLVMVTVQLNELRSSHTGLMPALRWIALAAVGAAFAWRQRVTPVPAASWALFRIRSFAASTSWVLLTNLTMYTTLLMIPFFVEDVQGRSAELAGVLLGAMSILVAFVAPVGGRLSDTWGRRPLALAGGAVALAGSLGLLVSIREGASAIELAASLAVIGLGLGLGSGPVTTAAVESAPAALAGSAVGTNSMMRYVGSIVGAGILAGVLQSGSTGPAGVGTFRLVTVAVVVTAALAVIAATAVHRFMPSAPVRVTPGELRGALATAPRDTPAIADHQAG